MSIIVFDIDGVLSYVLEGDYTRYTKCVPNSIAIEALREVRKLGHSIILHTARFECDREVTEEWLRFNNIEYDKLVMDKPYGDVYIDDKAFKYKAGDCISSKEFIERVLNEANKKTV